MFNRIDFLGEHIEGIPIILIAGPIEIVEKLDKIPEIVGAWHHVPVPVAVVVIQMNIEQPAGTVKKGHRLCRSFAGLDGMTDIHCYAQVVNIDRLAETKRFSRRGKQTAGARIVPLVLDAETDGGIVIADRAKRLFCIAVGVEVIHLENVVMAVIQWTRGDSRRTDFGGHVHRMLKIIYDFLVFPGLGRAERPAQPFARTPGSNVNR